MTYLCGSGHSIKSKVYMCVVHKATRWPTVELISMLVSFLTGGYLTWWSFCLRSNQSAPNCTYIAPPTGWFQRNQWRHSSRVSGKLVARWGLATSCHRPMWTITGAILGCILLSWATSWRNVCLPSAVRVLAHHDYTKRAVVSLYLSLVLNWNAPGTLIYVGYTRKILTFFSLSSLFSLSLWVTFLFRLFLF